MEQARTPVVVLGRFPPPIDGQSLATARSAEFIAAERSVVRVNTEPPGPLLHHPDPTFSIGRAAHFALAGRRIRQALAETPGAPVVWHAVSPSTLGHLRDVLTTLPALRRRRRVYAVLHRGTFHELFESALTRPTAALLARRVSAFVVQSQALADRLDGWVSPDRRVVIPNTVDSALDVPRVEARTRIEAGPGRPLRILFLSNMIREKGYLDVLEAAVLLHGRGVTFRLDMAGNWSSEADRVAFEARVASAGLAGVVHHHGGVTDRQQARRLHLAADVFVLPTTHPSETQPIAIVEALASGTAVVATDRNELRDLLGSPAPGALVPGHSPESIADAVARLAAPDRWRAAATAGRDRFEAAFAPAVVGRQWVALVR